MLPDGESPLVDQWRVSRCRPTLAPHTLGPSGALRLAGEQPPLYPFAYRKPLEHSSPAVYCCAQRWRNLAKNAPKQASFVAFSHHC